MKIFAFTAMLMASIICATSSAYAGKGQHNPEKITAKLTEKLKLDVNQASILRDYLDAKHSLRVELKAERQARKETGSEKSSGLMTLLTNDESVSTQDLHNAIDEKRQAMRERREPVLEKFVAFRNSLSTEQRQSAKKVMRRLLAGVVGRGKQGRRHSS